MFLIRKKEGPPKGPSNLARSLGFEAVATKNRSVAFRFERNLVGLATIAASDVVHLAWAVHVGLTLCATVRTTSWFVSEPFFSVERLLISSESKFLATVAAGNCFVLIFQDNTPPP